jgi:hypothetical protein
MLVSIVSAQGMADNVASNCDRVPERLSSKLHFFMRH